MDERRRERLQRDLLVVGLWKSTITGDAHALGTLALILRAGMSPQSVEGDRVEEFDRFLASRRHSLTPWPSCDTYLLQSDAERELFTGAMALAGDFYRWRGDEWLERLVDLVLRSRRQPSTRMALQNLVVRRRALAAEYYRLDRLVDDENSGLTHEESREATERSDDLRQEVRDLEPELIAIDEASESSRQGLGFTVPHRQPNR